MEYGDGLAEVAFAVIFFGDGTGVVDINGSSSGYEESIVSAARKTKTWQSLELQEWMVETATGNCGTAAEESEQARTFKTAVVGSPCAFAANAGCGGLMAPVKLRSTKLPLILVHGTGFGSIN